MSSRSSVTAQKMIAAGLAKSNLSLLIKHNKDSELKLLNSDKLRAKLSKNVRKMNSLTEQNDEIVELLKERGLSPAPAPDQTHCGAIKFTADRVELRRADGSVAAGVSKSGATVVKSSAKDGVIHVFYSDRTYEQRDASGRVLARLGNLTTGGGL